MYTISPSEVDSFRSCQRKHWYAYGFKIRSSDEPGIRPISHSKSLQRGTDGHSILGLYYTGRIEGKSHADMTRQSIEWAGEEFANRIRQGDELGRETMAEAMDIVGRYFEFYGDEQAVWQPLAAEKEFRIQNSEDTVVAFKPDGIYRHKMTGKISVWDHKLLYNLYKSHAIPIMPQLPKYTGYLRMLGYTIDEAWYNILSTRKNVKKNAFVRIPKPIKASSINGFLEEQRRASIEIAAVKSDPERWAKAPRTASYYNCEKCPFLQLCIAELEEQEGVNLMVSTFFIVNDYRYVDVESSED